MPSAARRWYTHWLFDRRGERYPVGWRFHCRRDFLLRADTLPRCCRGEYPLIHFTGRGNLPCVIYRYQIDRVTEEAVTDDIVKVSPLIEDLLLRADNGNILVYNPFVDIYEDIYGFGVYIKDPQPVIMGNSCFRADLRDIPDHFPARTCHPCIA